MPPRLPSPLSHRAALGVLLTVSTLVCCLRGTHPAWGDPPGWRFPASGHPQVLRGFAPPRYDWLPGHRGVDLALLAGQSVRAPAAGIVSFAGPVAGQDVVTVSHGELRSTYEPVEAAVRAGDVVMAGDLLGWLEPLTAHCGRSCLHWGVLRGATYVDPLSLVDLGSPVLLPIGPPVLTAWPSAPQPWLRRREG